MLLISFSRYLDDGTITSHLREDTLQSILLYIFFFMILHDIVCNYRRKNKFIKWVDSNNVTTMFHVVMF